MNTSSHDFDAFAFSRQPRYDETAVRKAFAKAVPLKTLVIYCYDPRAARIPEAVAEALGDVYPGEIVTGPDGKKVASTTTLFPVVVAGGRGVDALRSVTVAQHLFGIENIVVVHHTNCGATSFTAAGIIDAYRDEHDTDISDLYPRESICIGDYVTSLQHDVRLLRCSRGTPKHANIYGYMYDIDDHRLTLVIEDLGVARHHLGRSLQVE
jgi:carbonic anhydrase